MKKKLFLPWLLVAVYIISPFSLCAAAIDKTDFEERITIDNRILERTGVGLLRYWGFKVYVGAFYLERGSTTEEALSNKARRIEIEYLRPVKGKDFGPATNKGISKNVDPETFDRLRSQIDYHNSLYEDVGPGDRYSLTYIPGSGTQLALNGEPAGLIEGEDFANAVFSIWLGSKPICRSFKKQILGR